MYNLIQTRLRLCITGIAILIFIFYKGLYICITWNTSCFYSEFGDALPSAEDPSFSPKPRSIFFHETSCRGGLTVRQACAVEAAARAHPQWEVYVLFSSPVTYFALKSSCLAKLLQFENVKFFRVHIAEYSKGSIVQSILLNDLKKSVYPIQHSADILRILTLNKFGGIYLDTDMIVTRSLDQLPENFVAKENYVDMASGILAFAKDDIGTNVTNATLHEIHRYYTAGPNYYTANGAVLLDDVIRRLCPHVIHSPGYDSKPIHNCNGVFIYSYDLFYPMYYSEIDELFKPPEDDFDLERPYTYHMWDFLSNNRTIYKDTVYEVVAKKYCPTIHHSYGEEFATNIQTDNNIQSTTLEDISCHYSVKGDALPRIEKNTHFPQKSIFFHETSCRGTLNSRQACAVESAARTQPQWKINVFFVGPVTQENLNNGSLEALKQFDNIQFSRLHLLEYAKETPLEEMVVNGALNRSRWRISHTSDILRYLSLYKWGGIYLDLDLVVVKSFDGLVNNWAARESDAAVAAGALSFSRDKLGRTVAEAAIRDFKAKYRGDVWGQNGPGVITRLLKAMCDTTDLTKMSASTCKGFEVYGPELFYPINWEDYMKYFSPGNLPTSKPYAYHVWNELTKNLQVKNDSIYAKLAKEYCPTIYELYGDNFGA